jgi:GH15 family glucan-1,4-alpha-glucosidase
MPLPIEDYAVIGDTETAALVGRDGSIDWLCAPRFDSGACFAALLGGPEHGRWSIAPREPPIASRRRYVGDSVTLETTFETDTGVATLVDCMPHQPGHSEVIRLVHGVRGEVALRLDLVIRFDYGSIVPWVRTIDGVLRAIGGPDAVAVWSDVPLHGEGLTTKADFTVHAGETLAFRLVWYPSHDDVPAAIDAVEAVERTGEWWAAWAGRCAFHGRWRDAVVRSLVTLKVLTFAPTGGIVAAVTTSLPEHLGGVRNWDYRYCWIRDATFTLNAFLAGGYTEEAVAWRDWLQRAAGGDPSKLQILYGPAGERRLPELALGFLPGYEGSAPVRIGNAAADQHQLDIFGELMNSMHLARLAGIAPDPNVWALQKALMRVVDQRWREPDEGIWEVRGPRRDFTHSKVMAWVAFDRAVKAVEELGFDGPADRWRTTRDAIHREVCTHGYHGGRGAFVQHYGSTELDASLLMIPLVGFLPADDERMIGTVRAVEHDLLADGFVSRYRATPDAERVDGLPPGEGTFLACSFWLAANYALQGRRDDARALFERLLAVRNDVGLLSEEYDARARRFLGNFPQAFSHVALVNTARLLSADDRVPPEPSAQR